MTVTRFFLFHFDKWIHRKKYIRIPHSKSSRRFAASLCHIYVPCSLKIEKYVVIATNKLPYQFLSRKLGRQFRSIRRPLYILVLSAGKIPIYQVTDSVIFSGKRF